MATVNIGNLTFTHRGDYAGGTAYAKNDVVYYSTNGNAYIAKQATTGNAPTNGTYWSQFAAGSGGIWNAGLSLGSANSVVRVNSSGNALEFGTITSKLLGQKMSTSQTRITIGGSNKSATYISGLAVTYGAPVKNTSYFVVRCDVHQWIGGNHCRGALQYSVDGGSNWSSDWTHTRSGSTLNWGSSATLYNYPHTATIYNVNDTNTTSNSSALLKYAPSTPHSISDFRVRYGIWGQDSGDTIIINGISNTSNSHSNVLVSSVEVIEYDT